MTELSRREAPAPILSIDDAERLAADPACQRFVDRWASGRKLGRAGCAGPEPAVLPQPGCRVRLAEGPGFLGGTVADPGEERPPDEGMVLVVWWVHYRVWEYVVDLIPAEPSWDGSYGR